MGMGRARAWGPSPAGGEPSHPSLLALALGEGSAEFVAWPTGHHANPAAKGRPPSGSERGFPGIGQQADRRAVLEMS